jgi:hypothetical protein
MLQLVTVLAAVVLVAATKPIVHGVPIAVALAVPAVSMKPLMVPAASKPLNVAAAAIRPVLCMVLASGRRPRVLALGAAAIIAAARLRRPSQLAG